MIEDDDYQEDPALLFQRFAHDDALGAYESHAWTRERLEHLAAGVPTRTSKLAAVFKGDSLFDVLKRRR